MGKISVERVLPLLIGQPAPGVLGLLRKIIVLQYKMDHPEEQSFYFQMALKSHEGYLREMKIRYSQISDDVNTRDTDDLIKSITELEADIQKLLNREFLSFCTRAGIGWKRSELNYQKELLRMKTQFGVLKPLDEILEDEKYLMKIFAV
ncbi:MAG: hypothetical protein IPM34_06630 [Saprospiraceae bacterium]|nr:hypothetical protein [Saprospiraceae bacterium]